MRPLAVTALWLLLLLVLLTACGGQIGNGAEPSDRQPRVTIALSDPSQLMYWPVVLARQLNYYADAGVDVTIQDFPSDGRAERAMLNGRADVAMGFYDRTIFLQAQHKDVKMFAVSTTRPGLVLVADGDKYIMEGPPQETPSDFSHLKGRKIGVTAPESPGYYMTKVLAFRSGIRFDDLALVGLGTGSEAALNAIEKHEVYAEVVPDPMATQLLAKRNLVLYDTRTELGTASVYGGRYPGAGLYARTDWIDAHPEVVRKLAQATARALQYVRTNRAVEVVDHLPPQYLAEGTIPAALTLSLNLRLFSSTGLMPERAPVNAKEVLAQIDPAVKQANIDVQATYTNRFISEPQASPDAE